VGQTNSFLSGGVGAPKVIFNGVSQTKQKSHLKRPTQISKSNVIVGIRCLTPHTKKMITFNRAPVCVWGDQRITFFLIFFLFYLTIDRNITQTIV
jgi:hypothetical protein